MPDKRSSVTECPQLDDFKQYFIAKNSSSLETFQEAIEKSVVALSEALETFDSASVNAGPSSLAALVDTLCDFKYSGRRIDDIIERHFGLQVKHGVLPTNPLCAAHLHCPVSIASIVAEVILSSLNQSMGTWDQAPIATHMETKFIRWFATHIGFSEEQADGVFTSGGTLSNLSAMTLARDNLMNQALQGDNVPPLATLSRHSVKNHGLRADWKKFRVFCSEDAHFTIARSCAILGLGQSAIHTVPTDERGRMYTPALEKALEEAQAARLIPMAIIATAGTTDLGAIDDLSTIGRLAKQYGCWFHVDAAYGGALLLSAYKHRLNGISSADSVTVDFHKMFFQPVSCSAVFVRDKSLLSPLHFSSDYFNRMDDCEPNLVEKSLATTRRFDALKIWFSLEHFGLDVFASMVDKLLELTRYCANLVESSEKLELYRQPELSTVLFRFKEKSDFFHSKLRRQLLYKGEVVIAETKKSGQVFLKITLVNPCASFEDIEYILKTVLASADNTL